VFGVPTARSKDASATRLCGPPDGWREATEWVARSLKTRFGDQVRVEYFDLFFDAVDAFPQAMDAVAQGAKPPLVFVGDELLSTGERISGPAIRRRLEVLGLAEVLERNEPAALATVVEAAVAVAHRPRR